MMIGGLIFLFVLAYVIQLVIVVSALAHEMDEGEHNIFNDFKHFLIMLIPMILYVAIIFYGIIAVKKHFKKKTDD